VVGAWVLHLRDLLVDVSGRLTEVVHVQAHRLVHTRDASVEHGDESDDEDDGHGGHADGEEGGDASGHFW